jgi:hypothetical protein
MGECNTSGGTLPWGHVHYHDYSDSHGVMLPFSSLSNHLLRESSPPVCPFHLCHPKSSSVPARSFSLSTVAAHGLPSLRLDMMPLSNPPPRKCWTSMT